MIGGGLRLLVMEQYADVHWRDIRDKWGLDVDGEWKAGTDKSFPCHGGKHWTRTEVNMFMWQHACVRLIQGVWTQISISSGARGGGVSRYLCPSSTRLKQENVGVALQVRRVLAYDASVVCGLRYVVVGCGRCGGYVRVGRGGNS